MGGIDRAKRPKKTLKIGKSLVSPKWMFCRPDQVSCRSIWGRWTRWKHFQTHLKHIWGSSVFQRRHVAWFWRDFIYSEQLEMRMLHDYLHSWSTPPTSTARKNFLIGPMDMLKSLNYIYMIRAIKRTSTHDRTTSRSKKTRWFRNISNFCLDNNFSDPNPEIWATPNFWWSWLAIDSLDFNRAQKSFGRSNWYV